MKLYFAKHQDESLTIANWPIRETGAESYEFEVDDEIKKLVDEGVKDFKIEDGQLLVVDSTRKAEAEAAKQQRIADLEELEEVKEKLEKKEATLEEIQTILSKLI